MRQGKILDQAGKLDAALQNSGWFSGVKSEKGISTDIFSFLNRNLAKTTGSSIVFKGEAFFIDRCTLKQVKEDLGFRKYSTGGGPLWSIYTEKLDEGAAAILAKYKAHPDSNVLKFSVTSRWGADGITRLTIEDK